MEKNYTISAGLSGSERMGLLGFGGLLLICWTLSMAGLMFSTPGVFSFYLRLSLDMTLTFVFVLLIRLFLTKEMRQTVFTVTDTALLKKNPYRLITLYYEEIAGLRFVAIPFIGRFLSVRHSRGSVRIPLRVAHCSDLIKSVLDSMAQSGPVASTSERAVSRYIKAVFIGEKSDSRLRRMTPVFTLAILLTVCAGIFSSFFIWDLPLYAVFVWLLYGLLIDSLWILFSERMLSAGLAKEFDLIGEKAECVDFSGIYFRTAAMFLAIYLGSGILFYGYYY